MLRATFVGGLEVDGSCPVAELPSDKCVPQYLCPNKVTNRVLWYQLRLSNLTFVPMQNFGRRLCQKLHGGLRRPGPSEFRKQQLGKVT